MNPVRSVMGQPFSIECWGWGADRAGTQDGNSVPCEACGKKRVKHPLWFSGVPLCDACAYGRHVVDCRRHD